MGLADKGEGRAKDDSFMTHLTVLDSDAIYWEIAES